MLAIANVSAAQAGDYYQRDDYYTREERGQWQGKLAGELGLSGEIQGSDLQAQFDKRDPDRVGMDLCFSAPKSCSMAMHLNDQLAAEILAAHNKAVSTSLDNYEQNYIYYRKTENHVTTPHQSAGMCCAKFVHYVSRNQDADLHTHSVMLNETRGSDGKLRAISNEEIYRNKLHNGQIYRNEMAFNMQNAGYKIVVTDREKGFYEIEGISRDQIMTHSTRRAEIEGWLKDHAKYSHSGEIAEVAARMTRQAKEHKDFGLLRESWRQSFRDVGISVGSIERGGRRWKPAGPQEIRAIFDDAAKKISGQAFAFQREAFEMTALRAGLGRGVRIQDVDTYIRENLISRNFESTTILDRKGIPGEYLTTKESIALEKSIIDRVEQSKGKFHGVAVASILAHVQDSTLSSEQAGAVQHICGSRDGYTAIQGYAGTGKTFMLNEARQVWEKAGYQVRGMSFTGKAAKGLQNDAKIESVTIHRHLNNLEKEAGGRLQGEDYTQKQDWRLEHLQKGSKPEIWVVDEASMVSNRLMAQLQTAAGLKGAQVVMIGDRRQLQPVGAGNAFSQMIDQGKIEYCEMKHIERQKDPTLKDRNDQRHADYYLRQAVVDAAQGKIAESVDRLDGHTVEIRDRCERFAQLAADFACQSAAERQNSVILTGSNFDRCELNAQVREELKARDELQPGQQYEIRGQSNANEMREFAPGDKIIFLQNDSRLGVSNGQTGYIKEISGDSFRIESAGNRVDVDLGDYNRIDHGYAMTTYKAEGITEDRAFIHLNTRQAQLNSANSYYVDVSRARHDVRIYTDDKNKLSGAVERQQEKLSAKDFPRAQAQPDVQKRTEDAAFRELPRAARGEILRGDRNMKRAETCERKADINTNKAETCRQRAEKYHAADRPRLAERNARSAEKYDRKADTCRELKARYEQKASSNYERAAQANTKHLERHGLGHELKANQEQRPGVTIGGREDRRPIEIRQDKTQERQPAAQGKEAQLAWPGADELAAYKRDRLLTPLENPFEQARMRDKMFDPIPSPARPGQEQQRPGPEVITSHTPMPGAPKRQPERGPERSGPEMER